VHRNDFFAALKTGELARAYLFQGPEGYVKERAIQALREKLLPPGFEMLNETVLEQPKAREIIDAAETLPMFCARRLVVAWDFPPLAAAKSQREQEEAQMIADWLPNAPETCCAIFALRGSGDGRKKSVKAIQQALTTVEFSNLDEREMEKWIAARAKRIGASMSPGASSKLAFYAGPTLTRIEQELIKLAAYVGDAHAITGEDVARMVTPSLESSVFKLIDLFLDGRMGQAQGLLKELLTGGETPVGILYMLTRQVRAVLSVKQLESQGVRPADVAKRLNMNPYACKRAASQARRFSPAALQSAYARLVDADESIKSGAARDIDALQGAIFRIFSARG
jgi:DNA polymerase-3 subunit delta